MATTRTSQITFELDDARREELDTLARATDRDPGRLIHDAIDAYLALNRRRIGHIREGLRQADAGEFATDAEIEATFARWR